MIPVATAREMRAIDEETIRHHVPGLTLMERAGEGVRDEIVARWDKKTGRRVVVVCGKGNNGGDGLVVSRLLKRDGYQVRVHLVGKAGDVKGDALAMLKRCRNAGIGIKEVTLERLTALAEDLAAADVVVDALFGTGFEGEPEGIAANVITLINQTQASTIAVDIPSGVDATTGEAALAVSADVTVAMGLPKRGHLFFPGKALAGELVIADIGIPYEVVRRAGIKVFLLPRQDVKAALPQRPGDAHKWSCGHVVCVCGSTGLTGAAALSAHSALRAGAGLVTLAIPRSLNAIMEAKLTEVMTLPVDETPQGSFSLKALDTLRELAKRANCVVVGPGLSQHEETVGLVRALLPTLGCPCVLDADGINAFAGRADELKSAKGPLVITPHIGEASRLFGVDKAEIAPRLVEFAAEKARHLGAVLVLKGAPTVVAGPRGEVFINPTGNQGLATAGSGDVLTGIIAGLVAQGVPPLKAAFCGAFIHGVCGDLLLAEERYFGFLAGEIADAIPTAMWSVLSEME